MPVHQVMPVVGLDYQVNGVKARCVAVANQPRAEMAISSARHGDDRGTYVHLRKIKKNGDLVKSSTMTFYNCANEPSWYEQQVELLSAEKKEEG